MQSQSCKAFCTSEAEKEHFGVVRAPGDSTLDHWCFGGGLQGPEEPHSAWVVCFPPDQTLTACTAEEAGANEYAEEAEEEEGLGPRQSSGLSHLEYGADDNEANKVRKNRRQIKASGRAVGKTNRRRRLDEEDEQAEEARATRKRKRGQA